MARFSYFIMYLVFLTRSLEAFYFILKFKCLTEINLGSIASMSIFPCA